MGTSPIAARRGSEVRSRVARDDGDRSDPERESESGKCRAEAIEQHLQLLEFARRSFVVQPFLERAVEALELAECLGSDAVGDPLDHA